MEILALKMKILPLKTDSFSMGQIVLLQESLRPDGATLY